MASSTLPTSISATALTIVLVGGLAATMIVSSEITSSPRSFWESWSPTYWRFDSGGRHISIVAACPYTMQLVSRDFQSHVLVVWLPLAALMVTAVTVVSPLSYGTSATILIRG